MIFCLMATTRELAGIRYTQIIVSQTMGKHHASLLKVLADMLISTRCENKARAWLSCQESGWTVC
jgi:hypothetical protein